MSKKKFLLFRLFLLIANIVAILCLLFAYLAAYVSPDKFSYFAYFGLAYPFLFFVNIVFVIIWIIFFSKYFLLSLVVLLINWGNFPIGMSLKKMTDVEKQQGDIKVMSYNAHFFNSKWEITEQSEQDKETIFDLLKQEDADIICFQEFFSNTKKLNMIDALENKFHYKYTTARKSSSGIAAGLTIVSKYPVVNFNRKFFENSANSYMYADIVFNDDTIRFFNLHLESIKFTESEKSFYEKMSELDNDSIRKGGNTLYYKLKTAFEKRAGQARLVAKMIKESPYPVVVCGDFNDSPASYAYRIVSKKLKDTFKQKGTGLGQTYNGKMPAFRIDYILHDSFFEALTFKVDKTNLSDHYPVVSILRTKTK